LTYDVAIVGCGPVGALAGNLLGKAGLSVLILEKSPEIPASSRATHLDHEAMRLLQDVGLSTRAESIMRETDGHLHVGADLGVIRYMGTKGMSRPYGWANDYFFFQPELESCLRSGLERYPNVIVRSGEELLRLEQDRDAVILHGATTSARARFLIACDGARSAVRKWLAIGLSDLDFEETWLVVDAEVESAVTFPPISGLPADINLQRLSTMMCDPKRPATIVPGPRNLRRWEFMLLPGEDEQQMMRRDAVSRLVGPWLQDVPHRITRASTYTFHGLIADRWQVGRLFLAGDAAHQTPPFFGQGMCHGMRDVANLAWKLALVSRDAADATLLSTYQIEREPHVRTITTAAIEAGRYICLLDPAQAAKRDASLRERSRSTPHATAADLIPPLAQGVIAAETAGCGERFIQPRVGGLLLDDVVGTGWRIFAAGPDEAGRAAALAQQLLPDLDVAAIDVSRLPDNQSLVSWLDSRKARYALVRPDFYVFGTGHEPSELLRGLAAALRPISKLKPDFPANPGSSREATQH
jgi:3-(3-hydroxy-phenyl)propionate hydroxylase